MEEKWNYYMRDCVHSENLEYNTRYVRNQNIIENKQQKPQPTNRPTLEPIKNTKEKCIVVPAYETMYFKSPWISSDMFLGEDELFI